MVRNQGLYLSSFKRLPFFGLLGWSEVAGAVQLGVLPSCPYLALKQTREIRAKGIRSYGILRPLSPTLVTLNGTALGRGRIAIESCAADKPTTYFDSCY